MTSAVIETASQAAEAIRQSVRFATSTRAREIENFYTVRGLGRSSALVQALAKNDLQAVDEVVRHAVASLEPIIGGRGSLAEVDETVDLACEAVVSLTNPEIDWARKCAQEYAALSGLPTPPAIERLIDAEAARIVNVYQQDLRVLGSRRRLQIETPRYFPDVPMAAWSEKYVHFIDASDIVTDDDLEMLLDLMYQSPEHEFYLFLEEAESLPDTFAKARQDGTIIVKNTEWHFYRHPRFGHDYVRIQPGKERWDWEKEVVAKGPSFNRLTITLSERLRIERAVRAVKAGPDLSAIESSLWVLECAQSIRQGTAFALHGFGVVTCQHVLGTATVAVKPSTAERLPIRPIAMSEDFDLALIDFDHDGCGELIAAVIEPKVKDTVWVVGFPNWRVGQSATMHPGIVSGFRPVRGVRRILVSAPIIAGMSGSPVLNDRGEVIGIAVTGADRMEDAPGTEDHGVIPVNTLGFATSGSSSEHA